MKGIKNNLCNFIIYPVIKFYTEKPSKSTQAATLKDLTSKNASQCHNGLLQSHRDAEQSINENTEGGVKWRAELTYLSTFFWRVKLIRLVFVCQCQTQI